MRLQRGLSLIELMIAMTLGMGVTLASLALLDGALVEDTARYALDIVGRTVRQANYAPYEHPASRSGNSQLESRSSALDGAKPNTSNHSSDVLVIRYFGSGLGNKPDSSILNCAGFAVAAPVDQQRDWSIFYVATKTTGEPELYCKYMTRRGGWNAIAIMRGVEALQVL